MPGLGYCSTLHLSLPFLFSLHLVLVGMTEIILQSCGKNNFPERERESIIFFFLPRDNI